MYMQICFRCIALPSTPHIHSLSLSLSPSLPPSLSLSLSLSLSPALQLVHECRDTLKEAIGVRKKYREVMEVVTRDDHTLEQVEVDMEFFETDLNKVLMVSGERVN